MTLPATTTLDQARARADRIRASAVAVADWLADIRGAYAARDWEALGYPTWQEYLDGEFGEHRISLPVEERREVVGVMARAGMSVRAIAPALGVSVGTVQADRASTVQNRTVAEPEAPRRVQSLDGRSRPAYQPLRVVPAPPPEPVVLTAEQVAAIERQTQQAREDSERRAAATNLRSVLTYLTSTVLTPDQLADDYTAVLADFPHADLEFARDTMTAIAKRSADAYA
ncbi:hypothetical protein GCM10023403_10180 [Pseudonocardia benzenivorans]|uniref:hypothetical protein n=1 Tax=Pseudonocardia benzenivorans TaxID=228005 RepID=UPI0031F9F8E8